MEDEFNNQREKFLSAKEFYADDAQDNERRASRRFAIIIATAILLDFDLTVGAMYVLYTGKLRRGAPAQKPAMPASAPAAKAQGENNRVREK